MLAVIQFIRAQFFTPLSTKKLFWAHWVNIAHIFEFGPQTESLQILFVMFIFIFRNISMFNFIFNIIWIISTPTKNGFLYQIYVNNHISYFYFYFYFFQIKYIND